MTENSGPVAPEIIEHLRREILDGTIDLVLCYCSVFDQCWTSGLQDTAQRLRVIGSSSGTAVASCDQAPRSAI